MNRLEEKIKELGSSSSADTLRAVLAACQQLKALPQLDRDNQLLALSALESAIVPAWRYTPSRGVEQMEDLLNTLGFELDMRPPDKDGRVVFREWLKHWIEHYDREDFFEAHCENGPENT